MKEELIRYILSLTKEQADMILSRMDELEAALKEGSADAA